MDSPEIITNSASNLNAAIQVKLYVQRKMDLGASNKFGDMLIGLAFPAWCVARTREEILKDLVSQSKEVERLGLDKTKVMVNTFADHARQMGCGNCAEQSALAFVQLRDAWRVSPLDWMQVGNWKHGFVVIGRIAETTDSARIETWNTEATVCDPWKGFAGPAKDATYLRGERIGVIYRIG